MPKIVIGKPFASASKAGSEPKPASAAAARPNQKIKIGARRAVPAAGAQPASSQPPTEQKKSEPANPITNRPSATAQVFNLARLSLQKLNKRQKIIALSCVGLVAVLAALLLMPGSAEPQIPQHREALELREGEARMLHVQWRRGAEPVELMLPPGEIVQAKLFHLQRTRGVAHILVKAVREGDTTWRVRFRDGSTRTFSTRVIKPLDTPLQEAEAIEAARKNLEQAERFYRAKQEDARNLYQAVRRLEAAVGAMRHVRLYFATDEFRKADALLAQTRQEWREFHDRLEWELQVARQRGDDATAVRTLKTLLMIFMEDKHSEEYQKYHTLLEYVYREDNRKAQQTF